ncbi:uncharacterized protein B0T23DRAFT_441774 [Neurospora hispaniola]|uniref:Uncharacterized protein n=1 Tax=Neurospora hispaniola TaxID=588809 RepID=A0AAJ0I771_9PEZI|nr:hypothetical protein B0T23DRAFT_441774 [Neurospora hispaniola]
MACFWNLLPTFPFPSFLFRQERKGPDIGDSWRLATTSFLANGTEEQQKTRRQGNIESLHLQNKRSKTMTLIFQVFLASEKREMIHCRPGRAGHQLQTLSANGPFGICAAFAQLSSRGFAGGF